MLKPLHAMVAVRPDKQEEKTQGGIFLTHNEDERMEIGTVMAIGTGRITTSGLLIPMSVKVGDKVVFSDLAVKKNNQWRNPRETENLDENCYFLDESEIFAVIEEEDAEIPTDTSPVDLGLERAADFVV